MARIKPEKIILQRCTLENLLSRASQNRILNANRVASQITENPQSYLKLDIAAGNMAVFWSDIDEPDLEKRKVYIGLWGRRNNLILESEKRNTFQIGKRSNLIPDIKKNKLQELIKRGYADISEEELDVLQKQKDFYKADYDSFKFAPADAVMKSKRDIAYLQPEEINFLAAFFGSKERLERLLDAYIKVGCKSVSVVFPKREDIIEATKEGGAVAFLCCFEKVYAKQEGSKFGFIKGTYVKDEAVINTFYNNNETPFFVFSAKPGNVIHLPS